MFKRGKDKCKRKGKRKVANQQQEARENWERQRRHAKKRMVTLSTDDRSTWPIRQHAVAGRSTLFVRHTAPADHHHHQRLFKQERPSASFPSKIQSPSDVRQNGLEA